MSRSGDRAFAAARALIGSLCARGLAAVVVSPGSRSTPLVVAAARQEGLRAHVVLDERSAAFVALGIAKATGRPAATICTSGTAAANHLPAAVEATASRTPLVLLTADRPPELIGSGANQTIDQRGLFGVHAAAFDADAFDDWAELGVTAFDAAMGPPARAVHVNVPFDEPLVPTSEPQPWRGDVAPWREPAVAAWSLPAEVLDADRGVVVAGCLAQRIERIEHLARALGWPLLAEPTSNLQGLSAPESLVSDVAFIDAHRPEVVVQFGTTPTSRAMQRFATSASRLIVVDPDARRQDPTGHAHTIGADPRALVIPNAREAGPWSAAWIEADAAARARLDVELDGGFSERRIARDVAAAVPAAGALLVGNSGPVRDLAAAMRPREDIHVLANRGASGIDGLTSTAVGIASVSGPTAALIGDLSFLHDLGGFAWARDVDLVLVVINNVGGRIFERLPSAALPEHDAFFVTPHDLDLGALARAAGAEHVRVTDPAELTAEVARAAEGRGLRVVEAVPSE